MGRPRTRTDSAVLGLRVDPAEHAALKAAAERDGVPVSKLVRQAVAAHQEGRDVRDYLAAVAERLHDRARDRHAHAARAEGTEMLALLEARLLHALGDAILAELADWLDEQEGDNP
jgi:hypothetical protein